MRDRGREHWYLKQISYFSYTFSAKINSEEPTTHEKTVYNTADLSADGIAVDWLSKKIYWTDNTGNRIMVANYHGTKIKTIVRSDLDEPRAIVVDPENG